MYRTPLPSCSIGTAYWRTKGEYVRLASVALKHCTVNCRDLQNVEHSVSVTAETLYEAVARALAVLRAENWVGEIGKGMTSLRITVANPVVTHEVKVKDFEEWLDRAGVSPAEVSMKSKLRHLLKG